MSAVSSPAYASPAAQAIGGGQPFGAPSQQALSFPGQPVFQNGASSGLLNFGGQVVNQQTRLPYMQMPYSYSAMIGGPARSVEPPAGSSYLRSSSPMAAYLGSQPLGAGAYQQFNSAATSLASSPPQSLIGSDSFQVAPARPTELNAAAVQYSRPASENRLLSHFSPAASASVSSDQTGTISQQAVRSDGNAGASGGGRPRSESATVASTAYGNSPMSNVVSLRPNNSSEAHALLMSLASNRPDLLASLQQHSEAAAAAAAAAAGSSVPLTSFLSTLSQNARRPAVTTLSAVARPRAMPASLPATPATTPATGASKTIASSGDSLFPAAAFSAGGNPPTATAHTEQVTNIA